MSTDDRDPSPRDASRAIHGAGPAEAADTRPLVDVAWLREHLTDPSVVAVEVGADAADYFEGHIPGAVGLSWLDDLHDADRRGVMSQQGLERLLGSRGVSRDAHIILYGDDHNLYAAYAYWLLRYYGHPRVSLLDGGRRAWIAGLGPLTREITTPQPTCYVSDGPDDSIRATRDIVLGRYLDAPNGTALVDCRREPAYLGRPETAVDLPLRRHRLGGHIPGAHHVPYTDLLDPATGRFRPRGELLRTFAERGIGPETDIALYCNVGERSSLAWFVLHDLLEHPRVRNYDGGWAEYGSLVGAPVSK